jgi:hypothetical protein
MPKAKSIGRKHFADGEDLGDVVARTDASQATVQVNSDQLWVDERARCRLLDAFGELTFADLDGGEGGRSVLAW